MNSKFEFKPEFKTIGDESLCENKSPEQIFIEKRAELFLKELKKHPKKFLYRIKRFNFKFKYIKSKFK